MKSSLSKRIQFSLVFTILLMHFFALLAIFIMHLHEQKHFTATVLLEEEDTQENTDWVSLSNSTPMQLTPAIQKSPPMQEKQETMQQPPDIQTENQKKSYEAIEEALDIAEYVLASKESLNDSKNEPESSSLPEISSQLPSPMSPQKKSYQMTFSQLAQGFMNHMQEAAMAVKSQNQGTANIDQIKHINFCYKIIGCIVTSYKINKPKLPPHTAMKDARIQLILNSDGSIAQLAIIKSTGNIALDQFLLDAFQDASSSFPPLPESFSKPYALPIFNINRLEAFESTSGWYIDHQKI